MANDKIFIDGMYVKKQDSQFGGFHKISLEMETFTDFARKHAVKSDKNGKYYLNINIFENRDNKSYGCLDVYEPKEKEPPLPKESAGDSDSYKPPAKMEEADMPWHPNDNIPF